MNPGHDPKDGGMSGAAGDGNSGNGGNGGTSPNPDAAVACGPVMPPPEGLDPNNQVNPGPPPGDAHFDFEALLCRGEALRPIMNARQEGLLAYRYDLVRSTVVVHDDAR